MSPDEGLQLQIEAYRRMTPKERLAICFRLYDLSKNLARQGIKHQNPDWSVAQVEQELLRRLALGAGIPEGLGPTH
jgi:hypothetical protein